MPGEYLREAYPLTWPDRQCRTPYGRRRAAKFKAGLGQARDELLRELQLLGAKDVLVSSNVPTRRDGLMYSDARQPDDPGVAVYFDRRLNVPNAPGQWSPFVIACDSYSKVQWNLRAIGVTVEALRAIQRHGASEMLEQAFTGFAALPPAPSVPTGPDWWVTLMVPQAADAETIKTAYRELAGKNHPDVGGTAVAMAEVNRAYAAAVASLEMAGARPMKVP